MTVAVLTAFFPLQREPNLKSGRIVVVIRIRQLVEDGSPICRSCEKKVGASGSNTSSLHVHHPQLFSECKVS